jgi:hypothetical protein
VMIPKELLRARRLALAAMLAEGGIPCPGQFVRAGLPPLFRASEWMLAGAVHDAECAAVGVVPDARTTSEATASGESQRRRLGGKVVRHAAGAVRSS